MAPAALSDSLGRRRQDIHLEINEIKLHRWRRQLSHATAFIDEHTRLTNFRNLGKKLQNSCTTPGSMIALLKACRLLGSIKLFHRDVAPVPGVGVGVNGALQCGWEWGYMSSKVRSAVMLPSTSILSSKCLIKK